MRLLLLASLLGCTVVVVACGGERGPAQSARDKTEVTVIRPGEKAPPFDAAFFFPAPAPRADGALYVKRHPITPARHIQVAAVAEWKGRYPSAAEELGEWVKDHREAAAELFRWDAAHPDRVEALTDWAITNPSSTFEGFLASRSGWSENEVTLERKHAKAMDEYMSWCRRSAYAATELVRHGHGLAWAGENLYGNLVGSRAARLGANSATTTPNANATTNATTNAVR